jgi:cytochrome b561
MGIYSPRPARLAGQIFSDLFVLAWSIGCGVVALVVNRVVAALAVPARETARTGTRVACSAASRMLSISRVAVLAVSRAGTARAPTTWWTTRATTPHPMLHASTNRSEKIWPASRPGRLE